MKLRTFRFEAGIGLAGLGLNAMFVAYSIALYIALARPIQAISIIPHPESLLLVGVMLFALPGIGLAFIAYFLSKREALKPSSYILIAQGILMPAGMFFVYSLAVNIVSEYRFDYFTIVPQILMVAGLIPLGLGIHLSRLMPIKRRST